MVSSVVVSSVVVERMRVDLYEIQIKSLFDSDRKTIKLKSNSGFTVTRVTWSGIAVIIGLIAWLSCIAIF